MRIVSSALVMICVLFYPLFCFSQPEAQSQKYQPQRIFWASPERVIDGLTVIFPQGVCRLAGLDGPIATSREPGEPEKTVRDRAYLAESSRKALENLIGQAPALIADFGPDRKGRMVCLLLSGAGENVNLEMIRSGWAEAYLLVGTPFAAALREAEERAWEAKRGVWGVPHYQRAQDQRKRRRGGPRVSEQAAPNYWDTVPPPEHRRAPPCLDPSCR